MLQVFNKMTDESGQPYSASEYKLEVTPAGVVLVRKDSTQSKATGNADQLTAPSSSSPGKL